MIPSRDRTVRCATGTSVTSNRKRAIRTVTRTAASVMANAAPGHTHAPEENGKYPSRDASRPTSISYRAGSNLSGSDQMLSCRPRCQGEITIWLPLRTRRLRNVSGWDACRTIIGTGGYSRSVSRRTFRVTASSESRENLGATMNAAVSSATFPPCPAQPPGTRAPSPAKRHWIRALPGRKWRPDRPSPRC